MQKPSRLSIQVSRAMRSTTIAAADQCAQQGGTNSAKTLRLCTKVGPGAIRECSVRRPRSIQEASDTCLKIVRWLFERPSFANRVRGKKKVTIPREAVLFSEKRGHKHVFGDFGGSAFRRQAQEKHTIFKIIAPVDKVQNRRACRQKLAPVSAKVCVSLEFWV